MNGLEPFVWSRDVLTRLPSWPNRRLDELLPYAGYSLSYPPPPPAGLSRNYVKRCVHGLAEGSRRAHAAGVLPFFIWGMNYNDCLSATHSGGI